MSRQLLKQVPVSDMERNRIRQHIEDTVRAARDNHDRRNDRFRRYYRLWRGLQQTKGTREDDAFQYPMLKWITFGQWARVMQGLLGDDAEITGRPVGPGGDGSAAKAGAYMTWRFFDYMNATIALSTWVFRGLLFGRGHAECIYEQEYYWERCEPEEMDDEKLKQLDDAGLRYYENKDGSFDYEQLAYDGPRLRPLWPSQLIVPAQDNVQSIDEFEWVCRRDRVTPQMLLDDESRGKCIGVKDNFRRIQAAAQERQERDFLWDNEQNDVDEAEGVQHASLLGNRDSLERWRWYGKWRMLKGKADGVLGNMDRRQDREADIVVTYLPEVQMVVGINDLRDVYPKMRKRHPFLDIGGVKDGSYWSPGLGDMVEDLQNESSVNYMLFRKAGMLSVGPVLFYKPSSNFDPDTFEYKPGQTIPTEDPDSVRVIEMKADLAYPQFMQQVLKSLGELVTGVSDQTLGRASDRPNAPQTASGQAMLLQEGNTRVSLDMTMIREDLARCVNYIWLLDSEYADEEVFFRVTGGDDPGFDVDKGFGKMTAEERLHPYRFDIKFATSFWSKEHKKQALLQIYGLSMQNPIVQTNPRALWHILNRIWEAFGEDDFADIIPQPPEPDTPKSPQQEWLMILDSEPVVVNPLDDDDAHIADHRRRLELAIQDQPDRRDYSAEKEATAHIVQHEVQKRQKMLLQAVAQRAAQAMAAQGIMPPQQPGAPQPGGMPQQGGPPQQQQPPAGPTPGAPAAPAAIPGVV